MRYHYPMPQIKPDISNKNIGLYDGTCPICIREFVTSGRTKLLHLDDFCFIDRNDSSILVVNGHSISAEMRLSLSILEHIAFPNEEVVRFSRRFLFDYMESDLRLSDGDFITRVTMLKYPEHFHIHAYVLPFKDESGAIVPENIYGDIYYLHHPSVPDYVCEIVNSPFNLSL